MVVRCKSRTFCELLISFCILLVTQVMVCPGELLVNVFARHVGGLLLRVVLKEPFELVLGLSKSTVQKRNDPEAIAGTSFHAVVETEFNCTQELLLGESVFMKFHVAKTEIEVNFLLILDV